MGKKALIEITLVEESSGKKNDEIANEIFKEISEGATIIPWCKKVNKVAVVDS
jgi:H2-forming N5,N10-methylenetetrahydromethanopterin dehydrogenase-like enzyme